MDILDIDFDEVNKRMAQRASELGVQDIDPSAEFNKTMVAEQYRQSLSIVN